MEEPETGFPNLVKSLVSRLLLGKHTFAFLCMLAVHGQTMPGLCLKEASDLTANDVQVLLIDLSPEKKTVEKLVIDPVFPIF